ncbi:hypothetical protein ASC80_02415 [Afipia sp. Root123D2]|jgi:hypothetical protein|nr:hypothetical protein ASC80_02415 [Afipia sp. Root123D2]
MMHAFSKDDDVRHHAQGPQGRTELSESNIYTVVARMPVESDGRLRYRIRSKTENVERVVTEDQLSRPL